MRLRAIVISAGLLFAGAPQAAAADGGPMPAVQGWPVSAPGSSSPRYVALGLRHRTLVERIDRHGFVQLYRIIRGSYGVAAAATDGSTTGWSADRHTLVLPQYTTIYPPKSTRFVVLDPHRLRVLRRFTLEGFYTVDAISPAGDWLYLIHYMSPRNLLRYEVRAYDLVHRRLLAKPVVDPREPDEKMVGIAQTRRYSAGGRWAYTLYQRPSGAPFVHALDTANQTAFCIDLPDAGTGTQLQFSLGPGGRTLRYGVGGRVLALIDTRTFEVSRPAAPRPHPRRVSAPPEDTGGGPPVWPAAVLAVALLAGVAGVRRRRATYAG
jgi:MYXO-CTERM domain-containing protein